MFTTMGLAVGLILAVAMAGAGSNGISQQLVISETRPKTFQIYAQEMTWNDAITFCAEKRGQLASFESEDELTLAIEESLQLTNFSGATTPWYYWCGATKIGSIRQYYWVNDGRPLLYKNWFNGYPTANSGEDCVQLYFADGTWGFINKDCAIKRYPICHFNN